MVFIGITLKSVIKYFRKKAVSSLDEESKWSVHYTAPWHQQENVFLPGSRPPCVEELHCQAKVNLKTVLRECDKLRKDGFRSSQYYSQGPTFSSPLLSNGDGEMYKDEMEKGNKSSETSVEEEEKLVYSFRPQTPQMDNISDINSHGSWSKCLPLPTPEEKMRQQAQSVTTDIVPINITGENFDRQASFRRTIINTDTTIRRSKRVKRRKTITGVPENIKQELANNEEANIKSQTMGTAGQYSTLGHGLSMNSSPKHLVTCESGCQTDDVKIVPPSMRKIRSQRGQTIVTQMANISISSSGSISNMSDCNPIICTNQYNASDQGFHSLPRQGARISLPKFEANCSSSQYLTVSGSTSSLPHQITLQSASPDSEDMPDLRKNTITSRCNEFHGLQSECDTAPSDYMVCNDSGSRFTLNLGIVSQNLNSVHSSQSFNTEETSLHPMSTCSLDHSFSRSSTSCSPSSSCCQSPASLHIAIETESQCSTLDGRNCSPSGICEDSDVSESSFHTCSTLTTDHWTYKPDPIDQRTSSCSPPISNVCNIMETSATDLDASSLISHDSTGCYTSMTLNCKSYSHGCLDKTGSTKHNFYECKEHHSHDDRASLHSNQSLTRSISLRKAKKPPLPPKRTDSLQRKPQRKPHHNDKILNEQLISSHESKKGHSASFSSQKPFSRLEDTWVLGPRSESSVSIASSGMSAPAAVSPTTPTHSDNSSQHSEYMESWDFHVDLPHSCSEYGQSSQIMNSALTKDCSSDSENNRILLTACIKAGINTKMATSPDKVYLMTSPSSGYSSQSITPTVGTPVTSLLRAKSPGGRPKPKVPERKSSLRSSVCSSSTPVSSSTSDFVKSLPTASRPKTLSGSVTLQSNTTSPMPSFSTSTASPITPLLSSLAVSCTLVEKKSSPTVSSTILEECKASITSSLKSAPATSQVSSHIMTESKLSSLPLPPPPPPLLLPSSVHIPPLPGTSFQAVIKATDSPISSDTLGNEKEENSERHQRPVITAQALQRVQLRPIKLMEVKNIFTDIITTVCGPENEGCKEPRTNTDKPVETAIVKNHITPDCVTPIQNGVEKTDFTSKETTSTTLVSNPGSVSAESVSHSYKNVLELSLAITSASSVLQSTVTPSASNNTLQDRRSPVSPEKSSHSAIMSSILHQPTLNDDESYQDKGSAMSMGPNTLKSTSLTDDVNQYGIPLQLEFAIESDSQNSTPLSPQRRSLSSEVSSDSLTDPQLTGLSLSDQDIGLYDTDYGLSDKDLEFPDDKGITDDSLSSSSGSVFFKEEENDENDAVFDSETDSSSPTFSSTGEDVEELAMPARLRTTDDLFAAIHRSKRKVLGRRKSEEECSQGFITSPPITPTSFGPSMTWMPRQNSYIQQRLRRSTTSNDSFKALLLKKGSRSEPGFRMSATEMLKCTDPRLQRSNVEASAPFLAQCTSPGKSRRASEEWARTEGALPRLSPSLPHSKYGRSSTPPCAASSRYNSRSRIPSGPMTVICEREGELTESIDCCNISFSVSLSSSGTVCTQGST